MKNSPIGRRAILQAGGAAGLAGALGLSPTGPAEAAELSAQRGGHSATEILDLGPAVVQFSLMSSVLVGDTVYIGSRNLDPVRIVAFHVPTRKVIAQTELATGYSIQALAADSTGRYLYAGVLQDAVGTLPNLYRWDLTTLSAPATPIGRIGDRDVRDLSVAPNGRLYAVGGGSATKPALWEFNPSTGQVGNLGIPDPGVTLARAVAATDTTVFFGAGSTLGGGGSAGRACLYAYNRATQTFTLVTPSEMLADPSIRELAIFGDKLLVSSAASTQPSKVALMRLDNLASYSVATSIGKTAKNFTSIGEQVYFANESGLCVYSVASNSISQLTLNGPSLGEIWGVDAVNNKILATSGYGFVAEIDPGTGSMAATDLGEAGASATPQTVMGLAAGAGFVHAGGNGVIARHSLAAGQTVNLQAPGEAKDAVMVDGVLFTGQYSSQGIWTYDPRSGQPIHQAASFPAAQNRPLDVCWDEDNKLVLLAAQSDTEGGGSFWTYDPRTGAKQYFINPIDNRQLLRAVATRDGVAYLGGGLPTLDGPGTIVAFDPVAGKELWRIEPQMGAGISALAVQGRNLYGLTRKGGIFIIDIPKRKLVHQADISSLSYGFGALVANRGVIYGVSDTTVFRIDPKTFAVSVVVADINGGWYSGPHIAADEDGLLYTLRGPNLVRIDDKGAMQTMRRQPLPQTLSPN
ncbi:outer membrane protein assembly factor BamB family protein [Arthrobacter sp. B2a2-09]|uniref:outer membrane protein assembly factor BamB family protein n=1 Tax=Arthrobacter sp. B2a2-09 TaxID=2952822 RepID=UPI0022CD97D3|nr:PQQ-binding-like beta-propeller repeat protein [Arthrobacter sp. B2a2-09]MCZ9880241.1 PQQ-like beta-propeller repeat protein [Arthrobacter sp. B2a2-09]